jgi:hypothetical protein
MTSASTRSPGLPCFGTVPAEMSGHSAQFAPRLQHGLEFKLEYFGRTFRKRTGRIPKPQLTEREQKKRKIKINKGQKRKKRFRGTETKTLTLQPEVFAELDIVLKTHFPNEPCHDMCVLLAQGCVCVCAVKLHVQQFCDHSQGLSPVRCHFICLKIYHAQIYRQNVVTLARKQVCYVRRFKCSSTHAALKMRLI